jgi:AMMECR1 domain-containing protein
VSDGPLSPESRKDLLGLARGTLEAHFRAEPPPRLSSDRAEAFGEPRGLFVTLRKDGQLRGCIGTLAPTGDLTRCVSEYALRVLSAPRPITGPGDIEVGRDGLILELGGRRGLLLPQVAEEWGLDAERFLAEVSRKAGLAPDAWRDPDALLWAFGAEVFSE